MPGWKSGRRKINKSKAIPGIAAMENIRLAIDVESGDFGPKVIIAGLSEALRDGGIRFKALLCGNGSRIRDALDEAGINDPGIEIVHCSDSISPHDKRARVWRQRVDSSIIRCITLQKEGKADASVSAGDTAILMGAALFILGRSEEVSRPALAAFLPTTRKKPVLLLDVGANLNCRAEHLVSFAKMGHSYVSRYLNKKAPSVALLNIGKESHKGTRAVCNADQILRSELKDYIGYIEGDGVLSGTADVAVCDGFIGNVLLKTCETFHKLVKSVLGRNDEMRSRMAVLDPENYGAVPFLGIGGTVLKAHGGSSSRAIANAVLTAVRTAKNDAVFSGDRKVL